jgi:hypothetical protein
MKLYGFPPTRSIRALWTLRELDVEFEFVNIDLTKGEHRRPEFLAVNPAGKLPVLVDGDFILTESVAIVLYLARSTPRKASSPAGPEPERRSTAGSSSPRPSWSSRSGASRVTPHCTHLRGGSRRRYRSLVRTSSTWRRLWKSTWTADSSLSATM